MEKSETVHRLGISGREVRFLDWRIPGCHYDPLNPSENSADDYFAVSLSDLFFVPFCILILVGPPVFILFRRRAWKKKFATSAPKNTV